jgi:hypothetical protein
VVPLELAIERRALDTEDLGRMRLIPVRSVEHPQNVLLLEQFQ